MKISIFTSMTDPDARKDPWKESLSCYEDFADEVIIVGKDWPYEFSWDYIQTVFQDGFDQCTGDWAFWMDIDTMFHEDSFDKIKKELSKYEDSPAVAFPKYQVFTPDRYNMKTHLVVALNKKNYPEIKMNGGGDRLQPTIDGKLIQINDIPKSTQPVWNYDSVFRTKEIIKNDRARFARAWHRYFKDWGGRGSDDPEEALDAWMEMVLERYVYHVFKLRIKDHPKYIQESLQNLEQSQFGFSMFEKKQSIKRWPIHYLKAYKNKYLS
tara:strand:+ start:646 stop:1446 length:801 start_codon:yes stop_codon:yes gene_type:complete